MPDFIIIFIIVAVCIGIACALGSEILLNVIGFAVIALIIAGIVWGFMNHWIITTVLICSVIAFFIFLVSRDSHSDASSSLLKATINRKNRIIAVKNKCRNDSLIISNADSLLNIADNIIDSIKNTPESKYKNEIVNKELSRLDITINLLEKYNIDCAFMSTADIQKAKEELEIQIQSLSEASEFVYGSNENNV